MATDLAALNDAVRVGLPEVRACLLVSHDGAPLAISPTNQEEVALIAWRRLLNIRDVRRAIVVVGGEYWAFTRRVYYEALALVRPTPRVGLVLNRLDRMLEQVEATLERDVLPVRVIYPDPASIEGVEPAVADPDLDLQSLWREFTGLVEHLETNDPE
jgi:hypothetical protein